MDKSQAAGKFADLLRRAQSSSSESEMVEMLRDIADVYDACAKAGIGKSLDKDATFLREKIKDGHVDPQIFQLQINYLQGIAAGHKWMMEHEGTTPKKASKKPVKKSTDDERLSGGDKPKGASKKPGQKSGCFIATACYGSDDTPEVRDLRNFRDQVLLASRLGSFFVSLYYTISPPIAAFLRCSPLFRTLVKTALVHPAVKMVRRRNLTPSHPSD